MPVSVSYVRSVRQSCSQRQPHRRKVATEQSDREREREPGRSPRHSEREREHEQEAKRERQREREPDTDPMERLYICFFKCAQIARKARSILCKALERAQSWKPASLDGLLQDYNSEAEVTRGALALMCSTEPWVTKFHGNLPGGCVPLQNTLIPGADPFNTQNTPTQDLLCTFSSMNNKLWPDHFQTSKGPNVDLQKTHRPNSDPISTPFRPQIDLFQTQFRPRVDHTAPGTLQSPRIGRLAGQAGLGVGQTVAKFSVDFQRGASSTCLISGHCLVTL